MTKRDAILFLLEHGDDLDTPDLGPGSGAGVPLPLHARDCQLHASARCTCWRRSLAELDRSLHRLKYDSVVHHAHLTARYRQATRTRRPVWFRYGHWQTAPNERVLIPDLDPGHRPPTREYDAVVVAWRPWVDLLIVAQALGMLEGLYRGEVWLPEEAMAA